MYSLGTCYECRHSYEKMFETTLSVNLTVYRGNIHNWRQSGQPEYAKNEELFASF